MASKLRAVAVRLQGMEIVEQSRTLVVCHQSAKGLRVMGGVFAAAGVGAFEIVVHASASQVQGSPWVAYVVAAMFLGVGLLLFVQAEDDRIVLDGAAHVARIMRRGLRRRSMTEVPFASIRDVALEVSRTMGNMSNAAASRLTWRPVFVCENGSRVPWTPVSTSDRASQARAVAAARVIGGWNALPIEGSPAVASVATVKNLGCLYAFAALFVLIPILMMAVQIAPVTTWVPTTATVLSTDIRTVRSSKSGPSYQPVVTYQYTVGGAQYTSQRLAPLTVSASRSWAQSVLDRYPAGQSFTAWYDPKHPQNAILDHHVSFLPMIFIAVMVVIVLGVIYGGKRWQRLAQAAIAGGDVPVVAA